MASSSLAFFAESRIRSTCALLGHTKLRDVINNIASLVEQRIDASGKSSGSSISFKPPSSPVHLSAESASSYINGYLSLLPSLNAPGILTSGLAYFEHVNPVYPTLDEDDFRFQASEPRLQGCLLASPPFSALYHAVLALGCQYEEGGTFDPGKGRSWKLFQISLSLIPEVLTPKETLINVQVGQFKYINSYSRSNPSTGCRFDGINAPIFCQSPI